MLDAKSLYNIAKQAAEQEVTPETAEPPKKPLRQALDVAKGVATPIVGAVGAAAHTIQGFDKPVPMSKLP